MWIYRNMLWLQDLVAWVTMGVHHIPHTEDLPVTPTPGGHLQFFLLPYNYFDEDPSMASRNAIRIQPAEGQDGLSLVINRYGLNSTRKCVPKPTSFYDRLMNNPDMIFN